MKPVKLGKKFVGDGYPCYIIAEIGVSFRNFEEGKRLIDSAIEMGADAIKFQTYEADTFTTKKNFYSMEITGNVSQYEFHKDLELSKELQKEIIQYANEKGITIFSAPSHIKDLEFMKELNIPIYKIGSDLACHIPLLKEVAKLGKPIILSTGMCTMKEIHDSVDAIHSQNNDQIILLHCVADYPSKLEEANLNAIKSMKKEFDIPVGYSDHTLGTLVTLSGAILGANVIERHFRDERNAPSPDDEHSLVKTEFIELIDSIRKFEKAKGTGKKIPSKHEQKNLQSNRVSIIAMKEISKGEIISNDMIDIRRPGTGIQPIHYDEVLGKKTKQNIKFEESLTWEMLE
jgi:N,N'-diacetyllegionaminate synthase